MSDKEKSKIIQSLLAKKGYTFSSAAREVGCSAVHLRAVALGERTSAKVSGFLQDILFGRKKNGRNVDGE